jgi:hypothetical protein
VENIEQRSNSFPGFLDLDSSDYPVSVKKYARMECDIFSISIALRIAPGNFIVLVKRYLPAWLFLLDDPYSP